MIPKFSDIKIGKKIEIVQKSFKDKKSYISQFESIDKKGVDISVLAPMQEGRIIPISRGSIIDVYFINKVDLFHFRAEVVDRIIQGAIHLLKINRIDDLKRIQRREFYRFECMLDIKIQIVVEDENEESKQEFFNARVVDISGGGVKIVIEKSLKKNTLLNCELKLKNNDTIDFLGKVVRVDKDSGKYEIGIMFKRIKRNDRETVIRYIFIEQRKLRKRGLI